MDCPCLLGRTLFSLIVSSQKSSLCCQMVPAVSVRHSGCPFACFLSPAAFYLFVSAHICSHTSPLKLCCFAPKTSHSTFLACTPPSHLIYRTRMWCTFGPNRRYCSSSYFWHVLRMNVVGSSVLTSLRLHLSLVRTQQNKRKSNLKLYRCGARSCLMHHFKS